MSVLFVYDHVIENAYGEEENSQTICFRTMQLKLSTGYLFCKHAVENEGEANMQLKMREKKEEKFQFICFRTMQLKMFV